METTWFQLVLEVATIGCGLIAGIFLTFSDFVMRSLKLTETSAGIEAMQVINREVYRSIFMVLLWLMLALSAYLIVYGFLALNALASGLVVTGGMLYFLGMLVVTMVFNVPMNKVLDKMDFTSTATKTYWTDVYLPRWVFWNSIRAISTGVASVCFLTPLLVLAQA